MRHSAVISIVDDDSSVRTGLMMLLRSSGFVALAFASAREFLSSSHLAETSCVITDFQMPEMNGLQLQDTLRARGHSIPMIFITAFPDDNVRALALSRGAECFLTKPFAGDVLLGCIEAALKDRPSLNS